MLLDYFGLAWKSLTHKRLRSWLTIIGILIGVLAVTALISLGAGLRTAITSQFGISSTEVITVQADGLTGFGPPGTGVVDPLTEEDADDSRKLGKVRRVLRRNIPSGKLEFNDRAVFGLSMNIPDGEDRKFAYDVLDVEAQFGRLLKDGDINKVVLGYNFHANSVGLEKRVKVGDNVLIQDKSFEVIGITKKKGSFIFDNIVHMNEDPQKELFDYGEDIDVIVVQVKDKDLIDEASEDIAKVLRKRRDVKKGEEDFQISTPQQALENVNQILLGVQLFIIMIASISIIVGAIGIINTMTTTVLERKSEIGIMKSIGATNYDIFYQFLIESGLMGLVGGLIGALIGVTIGFFGTIGINNWVGAESSPEINFMLIAFTLLGSFLIGSIAGIIPALRAARQNPVDALRG